MGRKRKGNTITGKRIPIELYEEAVRVQNRYLRKFGKKISLQDAFRRIARRAKL